MDPYGKDYVSYSKPLIKSVAADPTKFVAEDDGKLVEVSQEIFQALDEASRAEAVAGLDKLLQTATKEGDEKVVQQIKKIQKRILKAPFEKLPGDLHKNLIASKLTASTLGKLAQVSTTMRDIYQPLAWEKKKAEITIGPKEWEEVGVIVRDVPPLPADIDAILRADCPFFKGKKVFQTHRLVLMHADASIDSQGKLTTLRGMDGVSTDLRQKKVGKPYWALITCDVIPDSRNQWYKDQKALVAKKAGYELPTVLEAITLVTMHCKKTGQYLLSQSPWTYTRCKETDGEWPLVVGAFAPAGLFVHDNYADAHEDCGVLAVRKF